MLRAVSTVPVAVLLLCLSLSGQQLEPKYAERVQMPIDRAADSYAIYSLLLPGDHIEWGDAPRTQWLLEDVTTAVPLDSGCDKGGMMNPHESIRPPKERQADYQALLADFDRNCHARFQIDGSQIHERIPVHMLDEAARKRYVDGVMHYLPPKEDIMRAPRTPDEFKGAAGMHSFTTVFFNPQHTLAMTQIGMYCGGLCGNMSWVVLEKHGSAWRSLPWVYSSVIF